MKVLCVAFYGFVFANLFASTNLQHRYSDHPFLQDFAEKIPLSQELSDLSDESDAQLLAVASDRNGRILVLSSKGLLQIHNGKLVKDCRYRPMLDMQIRSLDIYRNQFVYLTDKVVFSNAWAGRFSVPHKMADVRLLAMGDEFDFLVVGKDAAAYYHSGIQANNWQTTGQDVKQLHFDQKRNRFFLLSGSSLECLLPAKDMVKVFEGANLNCIELASNNAVLLIGTQDGYIELDADSFHQKSTLRKKLPWPDIRCIKEIPCPVREHTMADEESWTAEIFHGAGTQIGTKIWFGTPRGAFALRRSGHIDYYASKRWLVDDNVIDIAKGPDDSVLILSQKGLSIIHLEMMTLQKKAEHFDKLTRKRHVRYGLNSTFIMTKAGDLSTGTLVDEDNDGLWTSMYLAGELFRYAATKSKEALKNCYESFEAMERLVYINPIEGFPSRSFERAGYQLADKPNWHTAEDPNWAWKGTTSSDEIVGHFFAYSIFAEVIPDEKWRGRAITLMDRIMEHIVRNDWYLIDYDGKPTRWGRWNPDYINQFPKKVGDRRLNSIEIISFLQAAYHFTGKEIYKEKAFELLEKHGYLDNIEISVTHIGQVPGIDLTTEWNHSDDELAFLCYWNLYKYAFSEELRKKYCQAIKDHWEIERPEKNPLWNLIYAMTGALQFDLEETIWSLKEFPLDTISWSVKNSHRKDLEFLEPNFRQQTTRRVLPPDERPMSKYNANAFQLDSSEDGRREYSGDIFLLPYWMGRYLKVIQ